MVEVTQMFLQCTE